MSTASNVLGFGTAFRGRFDVKGDGSYTTTKWIVIAGIPVVPLSCWRHNPRRDLDDGVSHQPYQDEERKILFSGDTSFRDTEHVRNAERLPLQWGYLSRQLACSVGLLLWLVGAMPVFRLIIALNTAPRPGAAFGLLIGYFMVFPFVLTFLIGVCFDRLQGAKRA